MAVNGVPDTEGLAVPVFLPNDEGSPTIRIGAAEIYNGNLIVKFADSVPAVALQRMITRGELFGLSVIKINRQVETPPEETENAST